MRKCIGYGRLEGKCENIAGTPWTPHWCPRCDEIRKATISRQLKKMVDRAKEQAAITEAEGGEADA